MATASKSTSALWLFWIGTLIVFVTHLYMLTMGLPASQMMAHALLNLIACILLLLSWSKR